MPTKNDVTETTGTEVSVTLKGGAGYDAPWVVLRAPDVATARKLVDDEENLTPLLDSAAKAGQYFASLAPVPAARAAATSEASSGDGKSCKHGAMQWKSGFSAATGKAWQGWFCPSPKGTPDQCKPEFTR